MQFVGLLGFADVELGCEGSDGSEGSATALGTVVIEQADQGGKLGAWVALEERHCASGLMKWSDVFCESV